MSDGVSTGVKHAQEDHQRAYHHACAPLAGFTMDGDGWLNFLWFSIFVDTFVAWDQSVVLLHPL